jgi:hypothetical protein
MAVTSRNLHRQPARKIAADTINWPRLPLHRDQFSLGALILLIGLTLHVVGNHGRIWIDDVRYGRPRTTHLSAYVGHSEQPGQPTHFVAMNLNRRVVVIAMPGGDSSKAQTLQGPYLFGAREDLTPVQMRVADVNQDTLDDLIIGVKNEEIIYINSGDSFRLISDEERASLIEGQR